MARNDTRLSRLQNRHLEAVLRIRLLVAQSPSDRCARPRASRGFTTSCGLDALNVVQRALIWSEDAFSPARPVEISSTVAFGALGLAMAINRRIVSRPSVR